MRVRDNCDHKRKAINASGHLYCFDCGKFTGPRALDEIESLQQQLAASTEAAAEFKSLHEAVCTSLRGCESQLAAANARVEALEVDNRALRELLNAWLQDLSDEDAAKVADDTEKALAAASSNTSFQSRVKPWMMECFGQEISADTTERNHRFLEESLELVQACGCTADEAHQLVDYVYGRDIGEKTQEVGGVMVTLAALCLAQGMDMHTCGEVELKRIWGKVDQIRAKQAGKPKHSPLPQAAARGE